ncbi:MULTISPECIES: hypothetical protein [Halomonadaceae]|uniref:Lipoprotein n=1 Tax=Vreelandella halophila TaxID=86177 RepID=A0A9X4YEJ3_9GAMM|nr:MULTISPECIES: hypothetical protein [Halomonas]MYL26525.1 hypothetical protein [Halomonas utahensis]MYL73862.1 hypothetical protein [Halomonas sp. 22501_18_FS]
MLSHKRRQYLSAAFMVGVVIALSACDNGVEESEEATTEATTPESEQVAIPPRIDEGAGAQSMPAFLDIPAGPERKEAFFDYLAPIVEAVNDYIHHLNSHPVYEPLRERRAQARNKGQAPEGSDLAAGLEKYSAKGEGYIRLIRSVIKANNLAAPH